MGTRPQGGQDCSASICRHSIRVGHGPCCGSCDELLWIKLKAHAVALLAVLPLFTCGSLSSLGDAMDGIVQLVGLVRRKMGDTSPGSPPGDMRKGEEYESLLLLLFFLLLLLLIQQLLLALFVLLVSRKDAHEGGRKNGRGSAWRGC